MKNIYMIVLLLAGVFCNAQTFGATGLDVKGNYNASAPVTGQWLRLGKSNNVTMVFPQTPNGISAATTLVQGMLFENGLSFDKPDIFRSINGNDVSNNNNNANEDILNSSILKNKSKINLAWNANDGSVLQLLLSKNTYEVIVINAYK